VHAEQRWFSPQTDTHTGKRQLLLQSNHGDLAPGQPALFFSALSMLKYHLFTSLFPTLKAVKEGRLAEVGGVLRRGLVKRRDQCCMRNYKITCG